jgi:GNAT superfamily N-acetyltransferase
MQMDGVADWRGEADRWWAQRLGLPAAAMHAGGVSRLAISIMSALLPPPGRPPGGVRPAGTRPALRRMLEHAVRAGALDGGRLAALLGPRAGRVLGPAWYGYATAGTLPVVQDSRVRPLTGADLPLLARLHEQTPPAEREESGTTGLPAFGYLEDDVLLSVACLGMWREMPAIGVLTHPRARRRGLAPAVAAAAAREGLTRRPIVQYRARRANTTSVAVAMKAGFTHYCDSLVIDLVP